MDDLGKLWLGMDFPDCPPPMYYYRTTVGLLSETMILQFSGLTEMYNTIGN